MDRFGSNGPWSLGPGPDEAQTGVVGREGGGEGRGRAGVIRVAGEGPTPGEGGALPGGRGRAVSGVPFYRPH